MKIFFSVPPFLLLVFTGGSLGELVATANSSQSSPTYEQKDAAINKNFKSNQQLPIETIQVHVEDARGLPADLLTAIDQDPSGLFFGRNLDNDGSAGLLRGEGLLSSLVSRLRPDRGDRLEDVVDPRYRMNEPFAPFNPAFQGSFGENGFPRSSGLLRGESVDPHFSGMGGVFPSPVYDRDSPSGLGAYSRESAFLSDAVTDGSGIVPNPTVGEIEGQVSYAHAKKFGTRMCCAACHKHDIQCLSNCEALCYGEKECEDIGRRAYGIFCSRACPQNYGAGMNAFLPILACEGACIARVQTLCAHHSCRDFGCFAPDCSAQAVQLCRYTPD